MRGTRTEKEVEICATNLANKTKSLEHNPSITHVRILLQFLSHINLLSPSELAWSRVIKLL
jgi:hypothetical protein